MSIVQLIIQQGQFYPMGGGQGGNKTHSSPWFSAAGAAVIACIFFKSSESKLMFRQARQCWKRVLEAAKLVYTYKAKECIISQKLGSQDFWWIAKSNLRKVNLLYLLYSAAQRCSLVYLIKQTCLLKTGLRTLYDSVIYWPVFSSRTNLKSHNISVTSKLVKKS